MDDGIPSNGKGAEGPEGEAGERKETKDIMEEDHFSKVSYFALFK